MYLLPGWSASGSGCVVRQVLAHLDERGRMAQKPRHPSEGRPPECEFSVSNISLSERFPALRRPGTRRSWLVYQVTFLSGDRYYGITSRTLNERLSQHRRGGTRAGRRINRGEAFTAEVLCVAPTKQQALEIERLAVRSGNPWGKVLNRF